MIRKIIALGAAICATPALAHGTGQLHIHGTESIVLPAILAAVLILGLGVGLRRARVRR